MPIARYKLYKCPQCKATRTLYQGDAIMSFPMCEKCDYPMDLQGDVPQGIFDLVKRIF
jgi:acetyl-CoA carboxylase beta subunit